MGKVILTESQYQRLKKRLINNMINEADYGGVLTGLVAGGLVGAAYQLYRAAGGSYDGVKAMFDACNASGVGASTMPGGTLDSIAKKLYDAVRVLDGTDEDAIGAAFSQIQTIPDLCAVKKRYAENYPGYTLLDDLDGDIDADSEWNQYVYLPLLKARRKTEELSKKSQAAGGGGAGTGDALKKEVNKQTSDKMWYNFPCVPTEPTSKGSSMSNGSTVFVIGKEVFYNNGRMKKEDNTMTDYYCDANNKIVRYKRKPTGGGGGTPTPKPTPKPVTPTPRIAKPKVKTVQKGVSKPSTPVAPSPIDYGSSFK